ncbi:MAG: Uncharacterized protein G01um101416_1144 [Microgenomates group bacterium Gr01-1014_16]|nr:MAG: Uncharacterized protein G01um101416_1144 [Microgenomates group bacterium Gr01-1014_16]
MSDLPRPILIKLLSFSWPTPSDAILRGREAIEWSNIKVKSPVLDIGCGEGKMGDVTYYNMPVIDVGIDLIPHYIDLAKDSSKYKKVLTADARKLPFPDKKFNTVISNSTFEHIEKSDIPAIKEVSRILKPNGKFYLTVPSERFGELFDPGYNRRVDHFRYRSLAEWEKVLSHNGLSLLSHKYYFSVNVTPIWYKLFKISTINIFGRELWSRLRDSRFSFLIPKNLLISLMAPVINSLINQSGHGLGTWLFLEAVKK